jgi:hypothetical protein
MSILGLAAGFSPTLYVAQIAMAAKSKHPVTYTVSIMSGVLLAVLVLIILFQTLHLDTLLSFIDTTVNALTVSVIFNVLVGAGFVWGGIWYLNHQHARDIKPAKVHKTGGIISMFGLGFARTFVSVSGVTAAYIAGNIIANVSIGLLERLVYTLVFFSASIVPFFGIIIYMRKNPARLIKMTRQLRALLEKTNYRLIVGVGAIILGSSIVIFNLMMALFY